MVPSAFSMPAKSILNFLNATNGFGLVTYVGNSMSASDVEHDLKLYVPQVVPLTVDPPKPSKASLTVRPQRRHGKGIKHDSSHHYLVKENLEL